MRKTHQAKVPDYFENYAGSGKSYAQVWNDYSYAPEMIDDLKELKASVKKVLVLGAATGKIIPLLEKGLRARSWGCEIDPWAHAQIPLAYRRRFALEDMRPYVRRLRTQEKSFDLVFSNSLMYLKKRDLAPLLKNLAKVVKLIHFRGSFKGNSCPDPARIIYEKFAWWDRVFQRHGFVPVKIAGKRRSYLWAKRV